MNPDELDGFYQRIGQALVGRAPKNWASLVVTYLSAGKMSESRARVTLADGSETPLDRLPMSVHYELKELREAMYRDAGEVWYTAVIVITSDGRITFDFDYDGEPSWKIPVSSPAYVEDLELFPREPDALPSWLQDKVQKSDS
ncbi:antitoxin YezG family protein [Kineococcus sp. SYSU DK005]|uniref:hypothetical protein n=1 Tax=Kineococcus sp. SYSU DK005 TaxID=3383126 RepID=UPI003D7C5B5E